jgi:hypothetical protein
MALGGHKIFPFSRKSRGEWLVAVLAVRRFAEGARKKSFADFRVSVSNASTICPMPQQVKIHFEWVFT